MAIEVNVGSNGVVIMGSSLGAEGLVDRVSVDPTGCEMAVMTEAGLHNTGFTHACGSTVHVYTRTQRKIYNL